MSRTNALPFRFTLIGAAAEVIDHETSAPVPPARTELARVPANNGWRRQIVITEQAELGEVDPQADPRLGL